MSTNIKKKNTFKFLNIKNTFECYYVVGWQCSDDQPSSSSNNQVLSSTSIGHNPFAVDVGRFASSLISEEFIFFWIKLIVSGNIQLFFFFNIMILFDYYKSISNTLSISSLLATLARQT